MRYGIVKPCIGIVLIIAAIGTLVYWETEGRDKITTREVLVASTEILSGSEIKGEMIKKTKVINENTIEGVFLPGSEEDILGKIAKRDIKTNTQLTADCFITEGEFVEENSAFEIAYDWIAACSSSLRSGDIVECYTEDGNELIGEYRVAFVKDIEGFEIVERDGKLHEEIWKRKHGTGKIHHIEIATTLTDYKRILRAAKEEGQKFLIVQKGGRK